jgi:hypothetical protein
MRELVAAVVRARLADSRLTGESYVLLSPLDRELVDNAVHTLILVVEQSWPIFASLGSLLGVTVGVVGAIITAPVWASTLAAVGLVAGACGGVVVWAGKEVAGPGLREVGREGGRLVGRQFMERKIAELNELVETKRITQAKAQEIIDELYRQHYFGGEQVESR